MGETFDANGVVFTGSDDGKTEWWEKKDIQGWYWLVFKHRGGRQWQAVVVNKDRSRTLTCAVRGSDGSLEKEDILYREAPYNKEILMKAVSDLVKDVLFFQTAVT